MDGVDYVIDAIDYFAFAESVALHRAAREESLFVTTSVALGFGTSVLTFSPFGMKLEEYIGIPEDISITKLQGQTFPPSGYSQALPGYATEENIHSWISDKCRSSTRTRCTCFPTSFTSVGSKRTSYCSIQKAFSCILNRRGKHGEGSCALLLVQGVALDGENDCDN